MPDFSYGLLPRDIHVYNGPSLCGTNSVVECDLAKVEVAGSNPVSRSYFTNFSAPVLPHLVHKRRFQRLAVSNGSVGDACV